MATVETVARGVLAALNSTAGHLLAAQWVADRYARIVARTRMRHLRRVGEVTVPAPISAGTVTVTEGSSVVVGDATAVTAWDSSPSVTNRHIKFQSVWYEIIARIGNELRLMSPVHDADGAGTGYEIVQRFTPLDPDARWIGDTMLSMRMHWAVENISHNELDLAAPSRIDRGPARVWAEAGSRVTPDGKSAIHVELYPYAQVAEVYHYLYWPVPARLGLADEIPVQVDEHVLREGALIDAMRYEASEAARKGQIEVAAYWRNEYRAQETRWEGIVADTFKADRNVDDLTMLLQRSPTGFRDVRTARDEVFVRGRSF